MDLSRIQLKGIFKLYNSTNKEIKKNPRQNHKNQQDEVILSPESIKLFRAAKLSMEHEEIRTQKIADLKNRIQNGTYSVDSKLVAEKLLKELMGRDSI